MSPSKATVTRFRLHPGRAVAGVIATISTSTLAAVSPYYALLTLIPAGYTVWVWRAGTDADHAGVRVRALLGHRRVPWTEVTGLAADQRGRVVATLADGAGLPLTAVTTEDIPRLIAASGDKLTKGDPVGNSANGRYGGAGDAG